MYVCMYVYIMYIYIYVYFNNSTGLRSSSQPKMGEALMLKFRQSLKCLGICRNNGGQATEVGGEGRVQAKRINM
jgi:hypothetical protein